MKMQYYIFKRWNLNFYKNYKEIIDFKNYKI